MMRRVCAALAIVMSAPAFSEDSLRILDPRDGDVLNHDDGGETAEALSITVRGVAPLTGPVRVNGRAARVEGGTFECVVPLTGRRNTIVAEAGDQKDTIEVWWDKASRKRYRFSVDDNIFFLKDLAADPDKYRSLFDHWYLEFWREMHNVYGAKIHINIYYQTDGFNLSQMPPKWKAEWQANAPWLHLSFHALGDKPDRPYMGASYEQIARDYDLVVGEIRRFAGPDVLTRTTTVHWAECPKEAVKALRDRGIEQVIGLFGTGHGVTTACYYLSPEQSAYCDTRPAWYDKETDMFFIPCAIVVNSYGAGEIQAKLDARAASPHAGEVVELLIHEQYFRNELEYYQADAMDKVRAALDWVKARGYEPVFWSDGFLGK
ncbi:MAG TPA: hypothetical protein VMZ06_15045 [Candidatus Bathyarchaeia archaeon]|nr:hypothetical protein [Candidatus Bathyarchaeia archaeon]